MSITKAAEASTQAVSPALIECIGAGPPLGLQYKTAPRELLSTFVEE